VDNPWRGLKKGHDYLNSIYTILAIYIALHFSENFENLFRKRIKERKCKLSIDRKIQYDNPRAPLPGR